MSLTKSLFSMACLVLRVWVSTPFALAEPGASGECSPVRSGRCAFWCGQHALGDVFCNYFFCACVRWEASAIERAKSGAGAKVVKRDGEEAVRKRIRRILRGRMDRLFAPQGRSI